MFRSRKLSYSYPLTTGQFNADYADLPLKKLLVNIPVTQTGSGTPSPDNIREFIGFSGVNVSRTGKNLFDKSTVTLGKFLTNTEVEHTSANGSYSDYIPITTNTPYYFSHIIGSGAFYSMCIYDQNKTLLENINIQGNTNASGTVTFTQGAYIRVNVHSTNLDICQIELGSTPTPYEPYTGNTYTISFGQTVYSAILDVLRGKLSITHKIVDLGDLEWIKVGVISEGFAARTDFKPRKYDSDVVGICDSYEFFGNGIVSNISNNIQSGQFAYQVTNSYIWIRDDRFSDVESLVASLSGKYLVYELSEPIEIPLGGIDIKTLQGVNNIFADIGTVETQCIKLGN